MGRHARPTPPARLALRSLVLLGAVTAVAGAAGLGHGLDRGAQGASGSPAAGRVAATAPAATGTAPAPSEAGDAVRPTRVSIPSIKVDSSLEALGLSAAGALQPPTNPQQAGWFSDGTVPGQTGPAVIVGHVDSLSGPAVFADLRLLHPGDTIVITLSSGSTVRFQVTSVDRYPKSGFPTAAVYGPQPAPQLRLITCGGAFEGDSYLDNVVVYARLAPP
jgi:Sortase domain